MGYMTFCRINVTISKYVPELSEAVTPSPNIMQSKNCYANHEEKTKKSTDLCFSHLVPKSSGSPSIELSVPADGKTEGSHKWL